MVEPSVWPTHYTRSIRTPLLTQILIFWSHLPYPSHMSLSTYKIDDDRCMTIVAGHETMWHSNGMITELRDIELCNIDLCDIKWYDTEWCHAEWCDVEWHDAESCDTETEWHGMKWHRAMWRSLTCHRIMSERKVLDTVTLWDANFL